ncbi:MAG: hypothetical protein QM661_00930 [Solimonas sp.]
MRLSILAALAATMLLAACSSARRCEVSQPYQKAETLPAPDAVPGLTTPESPSALRIPAQPADSQAFGQKVADPHDPGSTRYECLDVPPRLTSTAELQQAEKDNKAGKKVPGADPGEKKKHWWWPF